MRCFAKRKTQCEIRIQGHEELFVAIRRVTQATQENFLYGRFLSICNSTIDSITRNAYTQSPQHFSNFD